MYVPLCEPWPLPEGCQLDDSPTVTGTALMAASEVLWELSGRRYGQCEVTLRPCRPSCAPGGASWWPLTGTDTSWWPYGPETWLAAACGACRGGCACTTVSELDLPAPGVAAVQQVLVDGVAMADDAWALYDGMTLARTDGESWPLCQDWAVPVSGVGAWSVRVLWGREVPAAGRVALAELGREYARACNGQDCRLPANMVNQVRQGLSQAFLGADRLRELDLVGLPMSDRFVRAVNPGALRTTPKIWNPDDFGEVSPRRPGAVW